MVKELVLGTFTVKWVVKTLEDFSRSDAKEFIGTSHDDSKSFIAQCKSNDYSIYLAIIKYDGGGRRGVLIILNK